VEHGTNNTMSDLRKFSVVLNLGEELCISCRLYIIKTCNRFNASNIIEKENSFFNSPLKAFSNHNDKRVMQQMMNIRTARILKIQILRYNHEHMKMAYFF